MKTWNQKGSSHVVVIVCLVLALIAALGWVFYLNVSLREKNKAGDTTKVTDSKNTDTGDDQSTDWKTYISDNKKYSLKYPSSWVMIPESKGDGLLYVRNFDPASKPNGPRDGSTNYPKGYMNIQVSAQADDENFKNAYGLTTAEWYSNLGETTVSNGATSIKPEDVTNKLMPIASTTAKVVKLVFTETNENLYILAADGTLYLLSIYPYGASSDATIKQILDSFEIR